MSGSRDTSIDPLPDPDAFALLRELARDVAHELRSPIQSVVINLEVLRRRVHNGSADEAIERAAVVEREALRLHRLADAFITLLRGPEPGDPKAAIESVLARIDPILEVVARAGRVTLDRQPADTSLLIDADPTTLSLALLRIITAAIGDAGASGSVTVSVRPDDAGLRLRIAAGTPDGRPADRRVRAALTAAAHGLHQVNGAASIDGETDGTTLVVQVRLPRSS